MADSTGRDVTPEEREKLLEAAKKGIKCSDLANKCFPISADKPDFTITDVELLESWTTKSSINGGSCGLIIQWGTVSAGFGTVTLVIKDKGIECDDENMGKDFVKEVFNKLIDKAKIRR